MIQHEQNLDRCGCCEGVPVEEPLRNSPGLPAIRYRVGTHATLIQRMLQALSRPPTARPLAALTTRSSDDATVALLDAVACVADVLTFYQERIANEGFLRTATERRSVLELARAIGYELGPGVAAGVHLSFTVEDAPGSPGRCLLPQGTPVQSVPPEGKLPQVFETGTDLTAFAEWNRMRPRLTRPADMAILDDGSTPPRKRLVLLGPIGSFSATASTELTKDVLATQLYRLDASQAAAGNVDALELKRVYLSEAAAGIAKGELLLFTGKRDATVKTLVLRVADVTPDPERKRIAVDLEPLVGAVGAKTTGEKLIPYASKSSSAFAEVSGGAVEFNRTNVASAILAKSWKESDLQAFIRIKGWDRESLSLAVNAKPAAEPVAIETGAFAFREKLAFFGHNAPKWKSLPKATTTKGDPYPKGWDQGDPSDPPPEPLPHPPTTLPALTEPRTIWTNSQGGPLLNGIDAYLERPVSGLTRAGWLLFTSPDITSSVFRVRDAREASRADYGLSGRAMALKVVDENGRELPPLPEPPDLRFPVRTTTAHVASNRLELAELPIATPVQGEASIELDRMVLGLNVGQPVALTGERSDAPGVEAAEIAILKDIVHSGGRTTLVLRDTLKHSYVRDKLFINANVVPATHGETVHEILGGGDASAEHQRFALKKPPLTYVSASTPSGATSSLEVRVNGVRWKEAPSLYGLGPDDEAYVVRIDDHARAQVMFGDGVRGARPPSGAANITATYRSGIGPDGEVEAGSLTQPRAMPLGLRGATNALPAAGAQGPERLVDARRNAPLTVLTFERVVSLADYEDYARTFPGIGKARGDLLWIDGASEVHLTVAGATGKEANDDLIKKLKEAIRGVSDPSQRFEVSAFALRYFRCRARVVVDPRYVVQTVLAEVTARLRESFAFEAREFAQSVTGAEVMKLVHEVPGVVAVDLDSLAPNDEGIVPMPSSPGELVVPARRARWEAAAPALKPSIKPAELLLINPVGITLTEMKA